MLINKEILESPTKHFYKQICKNNLLGAMDAYSTLYTAIQQHQNRICLAWDAGEETTEKEILNRFLFRILGDNPDLFYIIWENASYRFCGDVVEISLKYIFSKAESWKLQKKITKKVLYLTQRAKGFDKTDKIQQIKYLYTYLATNISCANDKLKSVDEKAVCSIHSAVGALVDRKAVCDGISKAFKLLLDELGIENWIVYQDISKDLEYAHVWNVLKINGEELHADVTWEMGRYIARKYMAYEFFLLTEEEMQKKHLEMCKGKNCKC